MLGVFTVVFLFACVSGCKQPRGARQDATSNTPIQPGTRITFALEDDGLAEVARYRYERLHLGAMHRGKAALIIDQMEVHPRTYVPSGSKDQAIDALRISLVKDLPSLGGDLHQHLISTTGLDHRPMRLAVTEDDWLGSHILDWTSRGDQAQIFWRADVDGTAPLNTDRAIPGGYYFYEQLPLIVRAGMYGQASRKIRISPPQSGRVEPDGETLLVEIVRVEEKLPLTTPAGDFVSTLVEVRPTSRHPRFPEAEQYWLEEGTNILLVARRHEVVESGAVVTATYTLLDHARVDHRSQALGPASNSARDRWRATLDAQIAYDLHKARFIQRGESFEPGVFEPRLEARKEALPSEYISDPKGDTSVHKKSREKGGWYFDQEQDVLGVPGRMVPDVGERWPGDVEGFHY
ncbi:MAG: hypothetical protein VYE40_17925 [Myxococcota bacterium]|nr:hypothetical protein [Myxococcota bacterium]